jgi:hypothetical protein
MSLSKQSCNQSRRTLMSLEKELHTYESRLTEWTEHEGKFVLIRGETVVDFFFTYEDAVKIGYDKFKLEPFFVKQVQTVAQAQFVSRFAGAC